MLLIAPMMLMLAPAVPADPLGTARKAYSQCLSALVQPSLNQKMPLADFQASLKRQCGDKEAAYRNAIIADDKAAGMSASDAASDADDQVSEYVDKIVAEYEDYLTS
ncbi:MAG: hypothetical protein AB7E60_07825 [Sphingobium sp.]